jgi:polyhydroxyalkanoate synthase
MLTGRGARTTTWRVMDEWISRWSTDDAEEQDARTDEEEPTIGTNRSRKHGSAASRALSS